jgi:hypothetical protein
VVISFVIDTWKVTISMTAEIAIINKNAVALAADSAVTLRDPNTSKIYNTANKLFMLSKFEPVGIMIYGAAEFMEVPLETIIKMYRTKLEGEKFPKLNDYADDFFKFLESNRLLFPVEKQKASFESIASRLYWRIRFEIDEQVKTEIGKGPVNDEDVQRIVKGKIDEYFKNWSAVEYLPTCDATFEAAIADTYADSIAKVIEAVFEKLPVGDCVESLKQLTAFRIARNHWPESCGLVFAGFGELDVLPCVKSFIVEAVICDKVRVTSTPNLSNDMNEKPVASIMPFAQAEIVYRFIQGIDPEYKNEVRKYLRELLTREYPDKLTERFQSGASEENQRDVLAELIKLGGAIVDDFDREWEALEWNRFVGPVLDIVADLPKEDLAAMAESLVNLTSFKRRISREAETVGGPIDVAVISKGDGFIWIKRKHYFNKELNPYFFANYYRERSKST